MLVLSRKAGQRIVINDNIVLEVKEIRGDRVILEIEVPKEIPVHRQEAFDEIQRAKQPAA